MRNTTTIIRTAGIALACAAVAACTPHPDRTTSAEMDAVQKAIKNGGLDGVYCARKEGGDPAFFPPNEVEVTPHEITDGYRDGEYTKCWPASPPPGTAGPTN
jgi:hypothetical protein